MVVNVESSKFPPKRNKLPHESESQLTKIKFQFQIQSKLIKQTPRIFLSETLIIYY